MPLLFASPLFLQHFQLIRQLHQLSSLATQPLYTVFSLSQPPSSLWRGRQKEKRSRSSFFVLSLRPPPSPPSVLDAHTVVPRFESINQTLKRNSKWREWWGPCVRVEIKATNERRRGTEKEKISCQRERDEQRGTHRISAILVPPLPMMHPMSSLGTAISCDC